MTVAVQADPVAMADYLFGHDHWETSRDIMRAVFRPNSRVAVKACHASSKTFTAADCVLLTLLLGGDVVTTAPTWVQVKDVLWAAIHRTIATGKIPASEWGSVNQTEIRMSTGEFAVGLSTDLGVRFQGHHARDGSFLQLIADEAPGVRTDIFEAWEGISSGGDVRWLLIGNPVVASGPFYDIFAGASPGWDRLTIDALSTPNLAGLTLDDLLSMSEAELEVNPRPYLVTRRWVRDRLLEWGEDHPAWDSRVRGKFPRMGTDALIALSWVEDANARPLSPFNPHGLVAGVDVAGPGEDETVVAVRRGDDIVDIRAWAQADPREDVVRYLQMIVPRGLQQVNVDSVGMGHYFAIDVRDGLPGVQVNSVNVGLPSEATDSLGNKLYKNLKAEYFWELRRRFMDGAMRAGGRIDRVTQAQLVGILYQQPSGVVTIEKKEDARKRGVKSPDRAEALMLAYAPPSAHAAYADQFGAVQRLPSVAPARNGARPAVAPGRARR